MLTLAYNIGFSSILQSHSQTPFTSNMNVKGPLLKDELKPTKQSFCIGFWCFKTIQQWNR